MCWEMPAGEQEGTEGAVGEGLGPVSVWVRGSARAPHSTSVHHLWWCWRCWPALCSFSIRLDLFMFSLSFLFVFLFFFSSLEVYRTELLVLLTPSELHAPAAFLLPATGVSILPGAHPRVLESPLFLLFDLLQQIPWDLPSNLIYNSIIPLCPHLYHLTHNLTLVLSDLIDVPAQIHLTPPASQALSCLLGVVPRLCCCGLTP